MSYINCPVCNQDLFSKFDKEYIKKFGKCFTCDSKKGGKEDYMKKAEEIFKLMSIK